MCSRREFLSDVAALVEINPVQVVNVVLERKAFAERDLISSFANTLLKKIKLLVLYQRKCSLIFLNS